MKLFFLMFAFAPTDAEIMRAEVMITTASLDLCNYQKEAQEVEFPDNFLFCIEESELPKLRVSPF